MLRGAAGLALVLAAASSSPAQNEVPLDKLTTVQVRARLKIVFDQDPYKQRIAERLSREKIGADLRVAPDGVEYSYANGKPRLVWRYQTDAVLTDAQKAEVAKVLQYVLSEALVQYKVGGKGLLDDASYQLLAASLEPVRYVPPPPNTRPTISDITPASLRVKVGETARVSFRVGDLETPTDALTLIARSSDPALLPPDVFAFSGSGVARELAISPGAGRTGTATVTVTVKDASGLTAQSGVRVSVYAADGNDGSGTGTGGGGGNMQGGAGSFAGQGPMGFVGPGVYCEPVPCCCLGRLFGGFCGRAARAGRVCGGGYAYGPAPVMPSCAIPPPPTTSVAFAPYRPAPAARFYAVVAPYSPPERKPAPEPVVPREELVKGKSIADWAALYDAGYRAYWAGRYAHAVEYCAAAADLGDDPRAWYYLSLAMAATGDEKGARAAGRYAAAAVVFDPGQARSVNEALSRVQGPLRESLTRLQAEVSGKDSARELLAARPTLAREKPTGAEGVAGR
jgi:hypothetical protein